MSRLEEIQENYAKEKGYSSFFIMYCDSNYEETQKYTRDITDIYAKECSQASLEKASENAEINKMARNTKTSPYHIFSQNSHQHDRYVKYEINKSSIIDNENIVLL